MDIVSGICKVIVHTDDIENAKTVTATGLDSVNVVDNVAEFIIPSVPVFGRQLYTFGCGEFEKTIDVGYGQITDVWLHPNYDNVQVGGMAAVLGPLTNSIADKINAVDNKLKAKDPTQSNKVCEFKFGIDADGNYGYIKDGADSVIPFKTGAHIVMVSDKGGPGVKSYTVDISKDYPNIYKTLTADNFFIVNETDGASVAVSYPEEAGAASARFRAPKKSYNQTTGVLSITTGYVSNALGQSSGEVRNPEKVYMVY